MTTARTERYLTAAIISSGILLLFGTRGLTINSAQQDPTNPWLEGPKPQIRIYEPTATGNVERTAAIAGGHEGLQDAGRVGTAPVIVGAGDISSCSNNNDLATSRLLDNIAGTVITLGDNVYDQGTDHEFSHCYHPTWGRHKARTRPAVGNHEYETANASAYFDYFGAAAGDPDKGYYSYDVGEWHVIVLNSSCSEVGGCDINSPQGRWLQADLAANVAICTMAYWHHPLFNSRKHEDNSQYQDFWRILYDAEADVVLNGHVHAYERYALQDPDGVATPGRGIREFVVGTGGTSLHSLHVSQPNIEVRNSDTYGVLKLTLHPASYDWAFIPIAGQTFADSGSASCVGMSDLHLSLAVFAGSDQTVTLLDRVILDGSVTDDGLPDPPGTVTTRWSQVSGPAVVAFGDADAVRTTASFSEPGIYVLRLTADDGALNRFDDLKVIVRERRFLPLVVAQGGAR